MEGKVERRESGGESGKEGKWRVEGEKVEGRRRGKVEGYYGLCLSNYAH